MKRLAITTVLAAISLIPTLEARSQKCIDTTDCAKSRDNLCEIMAELRYVKAFTRALNKIPAPPPHTTAAAAKQHHAQVNKAVSKALKGYWPCKFYDDFVAIGPAPTCAVGIIENGKFQAMTEEQVQDHFDMCSEIIAARYALARVQQGQCQSPSTPSVASADHDLLLSDMAMETSLEHSVFRFLSSCVPDANLVRELHDLDLDSLVADGAAARLNWIATRSAAASGGS